MQHNGRPTTSRVGGMLTKPTEQIFAPSPPQQYAHAVPIPVNTMGNTAQRTFAKINTLMRKPLAKIVIATQQARL
jgi:hypothetical protein